MFPMFTAIKKSLSSFRNFYKGATQQRKFKFFGAANPGPKSSVSADISVLRSRSRELERSNPLATSAINKKTSNVIGSGVKVSSLHPDDKTRKQIDRFWERSCGEMDADGVLDFDSQQSLIYRGQAEGGDCFVRFRPRRESDNLLVPFQLQLLEAEYLPDHKNEELVNNSQIISGIEFGPFGNRQAYHFYKSHPYDNFGSKDTARVLAGNVLHHFFPQRPGAVRGVPLLAQSLLLLKHSDDYLGLELQRKEIISSTAAFISSPPGDSSGLPSSLTGSAPQSGPTEIEWSGGAVNELPQGREIKFSPSADVGPNYKMFNDDLYQRVASGTNITYEEFTGNYERANFVSLRMARLSLQRIYRREQKIFVHQIVKPVRDYWTKNLILAGHIPYSEEAFDSDYQPEVFESTDPAKQAAEDERLLRSGIKSLKRLVKERGGNPDLVEEEIMNNPINRMILGIDNEYDPNQA